MHPLWSPPFSSQNRLSLVSPVLTHLWHLAWKSTSSPSSSKGHQAPEHHPSSLNFHLCLPHPPPLFLFPKSLSPPGLTFFLPPPCTFTCHFWLGDLGFSPYLSNSHILPQENEGGKQLLCGMTGRIKWGKYGKTVGQHVTCCRCSINDSIVLMMIISIVPFQGLPQFLPSS